MDPDKPVPATRRDGEWYIGLTPLILYFDWDFKKITVTVPGRGRVIISNGQPYQKGIKGFQDGYNYIKLSALGFQATLSGDTLEII
jgi:hypothetical protein